MGEKMVGGIEPFAAPGLNGMAKVQGVPVDDDGGEQVEAGDPVMLTLRRAVADFALTADAQGIFQRMMCLAFVEADLCTALAKGPDAAGADPRRWLGPGENRR